MFAVIETGGKQYRVKPGDKIRVEKLEAAGDGDFVFDRVLLTADGGDVKVGKPYLDSVKVEAKVLHQGRADKVIVFKYHSKTRYKKKKGHRQEFTEVQIMKISNAQ